MRLSCWNVVKWDLLYPQRSLPTVEGPACAGWEAIWAAQCHLWNDTERRCRPRFSNSLRSWDNCSEPGAWGPRIYVHDHDKSSILDSRYYQHSISNNFAAAVHHVDNFSDVTIHALWSSVSRDEMWWIWWIGSRPPRFNEHPCLLLGQLLSECLP